ncbi:PREDICTED: cation/calcium exchanger 2 [Tarenaya hassleriana]|uniref:cation/calcium exchanger 2 n=1 Tax=Tarenaya hassleriana TaxID=28532 RepID=UPI00053C9FBD|nr:PREDICTED: cation/calcium exchanger 2 [Tarenaya hassleriana]
MGYLSSSRYVRFLNISFVVISCVLLIFSANPADFPVQRNTVLNPNPENDCSVLKDLHDYKSKCLHLKSIGPCVDQGFIDYLSFLYCNFDGFPVLGQFLLFLWLLVLFYLLGDTASEYFCCSLESLSKLLDLSPTIAGVTLLSLGNGAPDVFASLVSFMGKSGGTYDVGLNTVVGGAFFVSCVVVGIISILLHQEHVHIEKNAFLRDICFFLMVIASLVVILVHGKINLLGAIGFCSLYAVYVVIVYLYWRFGREAFEFDPESIHRNDVREPILQKDRTVHIEERVFEEACRTEGSSERKYCCRLLIRAIELPLNLPRRLTIPVVSETKWSKPIAVASSTFAPILLASLWNWACSGMGVDTSLAYGIGCFLGIVLGFLASAKTEKSNPPKRWLLLWLIGGFVMSMTWTYISAQELVALLTSLGYVFGISPSILGLTVLAWGNSLGDLITNVTMALHGGTEGAQVAISGCYAGPIFNTLFALGISLVGSTWRIHPTSIVIPMEPELLESLGFLVAGLGWAMVMLTRNRMKLSGVMGIGLLVIYLASLSLRLVQTIAESSH